MKLRIGAGTIITVLLALAIGGYGVYRQQRIATQPPVVERLVQGTTPRGITPTPEFLLRHRSDLRLSETQVQRIRAITVAYRKDLAPYQQRMKVVSANYQRQMERAKTKTHLSVQAIQNAGGDVQQISSIVVTTRRAYWQQARAVLTAPQRAQAEQLATQATLRDLQ